MSGSKFKAGEYVVLVDYGHGRNRMRVLAARVAKVGRLWVTVDHAEYAGYKYDAASGIVKCSGNGAGWHQRILRPEAWDARARGWRRWAPLWAVRAHRGPVTRPCAAW